MSAQATERIVIIGSGPAGWTAAIYAARANLNPLCIVGVPRTDPAPVLPGGQLMLTTEVENYPGFPSGITGPELMEHFRAQAIRFGARVLDEDVASCDFSKRPFHLTLAGGQRVEARGVIIATGAVANWLGVPNELRLAQSGGGVSACAVCDGALPVYRGKELGVVGGGDTAMEEAIYLTKFASKVHIIHRRDSFRASKAMQDRLLSMPNAVAVWNSRVVEVLGGDRIEGVVLEDTVTGARRNLALGGLFIAIGHSPATSFLQSSGVELDDKGYVALRTRSSTTNIEGVFAAGDVADPHYRQAITAAGMGCQAALECERWLAASGVH
ncbi:MAG: thioredoxin-disulfide reductase [Planctomycetes bacterium]|nr:thioredoxin-disulfide reductase [Planctomycetota bacterium]